MKRLYSSDTRGCFAKSYSRRSKTNEMGRLILSKAEHELKITAHRHY